MIIDNIDRDEFISIMSDQTNGFEYLPVVACLLWKTSYVLVTKEDGTPMAIAAYSEDKHGNHVVIQHIEVVSAYRNQGYMRYIITYILAFYNVGTLIELWSANDDTNQIWRYLSLVHSSFEWKIHLS